MALGLDLEGASLTNGQVLHSNLLRGVDIILKGNGASVAALVLLEWAEGESVVSIRVGSRARPRGVGGLGTTRVLTAGSFGPDIWIELLVVSADEAEVVAVVDAGTAFQVS